MDDDVDGSDVLELDEARKANADRDSLAVANRRRHVVQSMGIAGGRAYFARLVADSLLFEPIADTDSARLAGRVAVRDFVLELWNEANRFCPELVAMAMKESDDRNS